MAPPFILESTTDNAIVQKVYCMAQTKPSDRGMCYFIKFIYARKRKSKFDVLRLPVNYLLLIKEKRRNRIHINWYNECLRVGFTVINSF